MAMQQPMGERAMELAGEAILDAFTASIRAQLAARVVEALQPEINKAVDAAMVELGPTIRTMRDPLYQRAVVQLIVRRYDTKEAPL